MIKINELVKGDSLNKVSNGSNIFNKMKSEYNKDKTVEGFVLDFSGISHVKPIVFKEIIKQMQTRLEGQYKLELVNANPIIKNTFQLVISNKI